MAKVAVAFSGGKDSLASLIWAKNKFGAKNIIAVFCDTKWEHELTYEHIAYVVKRLGVELVVAKSKEYDGMLDLVKKKKRFPSTKARFCTQKLKQEPMIDWVLTQEQNLLIIQGVRRDESEARKHLPENCSFFKYYFEPYKITRRYDCFVKLSLEEYKEKLRLNNFNLTELKKLGTLRNKYQIEKTDIFFLENVKRVNDLKENEVLHYHTYRKKEVFEWVKKYDDSILRPVVDWTADEVIDFIYQNGFKPNPLYFMGSKRVGCYPCVMTNQEELKQIWEFSPEYIEQVSKAEIELKTSFFVPNYIPKRYCSKVDKNGKAYPTAVDVIEYITREKTGNLFTNVEKRGQGCMSFYNICER